MIGARLMMMAKSPSSSLAIVPREANAAEKPGLRLQNRKNLICGANGQMAKLLRHLNDP